jgi:hypothetical protein
VEGDQMDLVDLVVPESL